VVTRQVINGFPGLNNQFIGQSPGGSTNTYNTSKGYWNNNTQSLQHSTLRCFLYEFGEQVYTQSPLFCLVLGLGFYHSVGLSSVYHFSSVFFLYLSPWSRFWSNRIEITASKNSYFAYLFFVAVWTVLPIRCNRNVSVCIVWDSMSLS
jgi:hypothetical protein